METVEKVFGTESLRELLDEQLRLDAQEVYKDMLSPVVMRVRADINEPGSFRLLALRFSRMSSARSLIKDRMMSLIDHALPLDTEAQRTALQLDVRRSLETCLRVLESTDAKASTELVSETAEAMSHNIGTMSTLLAARFPKFAESLAAASLRASTIAKSVDSISVEMRNAHDQIRKEMAQTGPRAAPAPRQELESPASPTARA